MRGGCWSSTTQILSMMGDAPQFRIGMPSTFAFDFLGDFRDECAFAKIKHVHVVCDTSRNLLKRLVAGYFDVVLAFTAAPIEIKPRQSWEEPLVWVSAPDFLLSPGAPLPLLSWPNTLFEKISLAACDEARTPYVISFAANDMRAHLEAVQLGLGYLCLPERIVPKNLKIAREFFLPKLPNMHAGIYANPASESKQFAILLDCLGRAMQPESVSDRKERKVIAR